jgi:hypothetical protein
VLAIERLNATVVHEYDTELRVREPEMSEHAVGLGLQASRQGLRTNARPAE